MSDRRYVVIGAGVVGAALADELTSRGATDVTVLDKGPLYATGGSSSHAPGLISRTSPSKMMQALADYTLDTYAALDLDGAPAMLPVGTLEVALNDTRLRELQRRCNVAASWGCRGRMVDPDEAMQRWPVIDGSRLVGAYATEGEGLAVALRAVEAQARRAIGRGARFVGNTEVTGIEHRDGRVTGVRCGDEVVPADVVVCCAGVWGPMIAVMVGLTLPMQAFEHQYAITSPVPQLAANAANEATMPIVRHHDAGLYYRDHGDRVGIGSFNHRRLPVAATGLDDHPRREDGVMYAFTHEDFAAPWELTCELMPALRQATLERCFNGVFAFTPDGYPLIGEHPDLRGFWVGESVWVTHSAGVARVLAETLIDGAPTIDASPADLSRFERPELDPIVVEARCDDSYRDVYAVHHPAEGHTSGRDLRFSPFEPGQRELGAAFFDTAAWERPRWYAANAHLIDPATVPPRDEWSSRYWSPIAIAEHLAVRERAGLFDMSALTRIEVKGSGAEGFLDWVVAGRTDRAPGTVTYSVLLDTRGGIRSDVTVGRLDPDRFVIGANGPRDLAWLRRHAPPDGVTITDLTETTCCLGLWGPASRQILEPLVEGDLAFGYLGMGELRVKGIPVTVTRVSYAGELGWELVTDSADGLALWDVVMQQGGPHGLIAAGSAALSSLRIEKGYRMWGTDMAPEHAPAEAGLAFAVRRDDTDFLGRDGLAVRPTTTHRLATLSLDPDHVMTGGEPVFIADEPVGYVTSGAYGPSVELSMVYAWVPAELETGDRVEVWSFDQTLAATVAPTSLFDPGGSRLRA